MKIETLKQSNKRKYIIGSIIVIAILATITYIGTRAKYRVTSSVQLASGVINYSPSDLEIVAIKIQNDSNGYDNTDTVPTSGYQLNTTLSICKIGETKQDVTITYENGKINISNLTIKGTKCQLYFDKRICPEEATSCELIMANNTIDTSRSSGYFSAAFKEGTAGRIFSGEDDDGTTYFFAGSNPNNWVSFAGFYWRIIRINGDGSIRLIYNGTTTDQTGNSTQIGESKFSHKDSDYNSSTGIYKYANDNTYVGFMYGATESDIYEETHANVNSSEVKNILDTWYEQNLKTTIYENFIDVNAGFCGDRTVGNYQSNSTGNGTSKTYTQYAPYKRAYNTYTATYKCNQVNDLYTVKNSEKGNKALTNPIGLITSDEVIYAGGYRYVSGAAAYNHWLNTGQLYWTISPAGFSKASMMASILCVYSNGSSSSGDVYVSFGVRPVINLKSDQLVKGSGTISDPFIINDGTGAGGAN